MKMLLNAEEARRLQTNQTASEGTESTLEEVKKTKKKKDPKEGIVYFWANFKEMLIRKKFFIIAKGSVFSY